MAVITLSFIASDEEIVSGIPRYMTIESNVPSTIYFTLDATTPTINSPVYISTFEMSDGVNSITLSAFGIDADGYSGAILTQVFAPDVTRITVSRNIVPEGIIVDGFDDLTNIEDGFDGSGNVVSFIDIPLIDLELIHSSEGRLGLADGTQIDIIKPSPEDTPYPFDDNFVAFSTPQNAQFFNPYAKTIVIDDRVDNDIRIINRPWGSMRSMSKNFNGQMEITGSDSTYVSGGFVKAFFDAKKNVMVSYYFDHNQTRWVKSIQALPSGITNVFGFNQSGSPLVFRWLPYGRHSSITI